MLTPPVESKYIVVSRYVNGSGQVVVTGSTPITTSRGSPLGLPMYVVLLNVRYHDRKLSIPAHRQNDRTNDHIAPPALMVTETI